MPKFLTIRQLADQATFLVNDYQQVNRMRFNKLAADFVFPDLNMDIVKEAKREYLYVNKRTNTIELPEDCIQVSSVSWVDEYGRIHPVYRNTRLHNDIVDLGAKKDCACACNGDLCNMIKGYESVVTYEDAKMPNGDTQEFRLVNTKWYDAEGNYYEQVQAPQREYESGEWTDTVVATTDNLLCKLEIDEATGCVRDCEENYRAVTSCGCSFYGSECSSQPSATTADGYRLLQTNYAIESGRWFSIPCQGFNNIYNINDMGDKLIFPHDFGFDRVLLRYYSDVPMKDMKVPFTAAYAFICGIMFYNIAFDNRQQQLSLVLSMKYSRAKFALIQELNKYTQAEMLEIMSPYVYVPS